MKALLPRLIPIIGKCCCQRVVPAFWSEPEVWIAVGISARCCFKMALFLDQVKIEPAAFPNVVAYVLAIFYGCRRKCAWVWYIISARKPDSELKKFWKFALPVLHLFQTSFGSCWSYWEESESALLIQYKYMIAHPPKQLCLWSVDRPAKYKTQIRNRSSWETC